MTTDTLPEAPLVIRQLAHEQTQILFKSQDKEKNEIITTQFEIINKLKTHLRWAYIIVFISALATVFNIYQLNKESGAMIFIDNNSLAHEVTPNETE